MAVDAVRKVTLAKPTTAATANADARFGIAAMSNIETPKPAHATTRRRFTDVRRALTSAARTDPTHIVANSRVKAASSPCSVRFTNSGKTTEKL
jgi:hypothetical protein